MSEELDPCEAWPIMWPCPTDEVDEALLEVAQQSAQEILWAMTGRRLGVCVRTDVYTMPSRYDCAPLAFEVAGLVAGDLGVWRWDNTARTCCELLLTQSPIVAIDEVLLDGEALDPDEYLIDGAFLKRIGACWPSGSNCDPPQITITYRYGTELPALVPLAMGELGCELLSAFQGADCRLPSNVVGLSRQGVTMDLGAPDLLDRQGLLGLPLCDALIRSTNPGRMGRRGRVHSPDMARRSR